MTNPSRESAGRGERRSFARKTVGLLGALAFSAALFSATYGVFKEGSDVNDFAENVPVPVLGNIAVASHEAAQEFYATAKGQAIKDTLDRLLEIINQSTPEFGDHDISGQSQASL